jgi:predicted Zn-dependent peptidase
VLERQWLEQLADVEGRADELSRCATLFGDPTAVREWLTPHLATTADEVRAALSQLVVDNQPAVLEYEPGELVEGTV